jgi:hypothetical protein
VTVRPPHTLGCALCVGLAGANAARVGLLPALLVATASIALAAAVTSHHAALALAGIGVAVAGWAFGSVRLAAIDHSALAPLIGTSRLVRAPDAGPGPALARPSSP